MFRAVFKTLNKSNSRNRFLLDFYLNRSSSIHHTCFLSNADEFKFEDLLKIVKETESKYRENLIDVNAGGAGRKRYEDKEQRVDDKLIHVLSNGSFGFSKSFYIKANDQKYLFNCGESTKRVLVSFEKVRFDSRVNIFATRNSWDVIGGTLSMCLHSMKNQILIHAPCNLDELITKGYYTLRLNSLDLKRHDYEKLGVYEDSNFRVKAVKLESKNTTTANIDTNIDVLSLMKNNIDELTIDSEQSTKYDEGNANDLSQNGVYAYLFEAHDDGTTILVLDCPDESYIDFVTGYKLLNNLKYIVHLGPFSVLNSVKYRNWIKRCSTIYHIIVDEKLHNYDVGQFYRLHPVLNKIDPDIYHLPIEKTDDTGARYDLLSTEDNIILGYHGDMINLSELFCTRQNFKRLKYDTVQTPTFLNLMEEVQSKLKSKAAIVNPENIYPQVIFLGTGSSYTRPSRNVTSILVNLTSDTSIVVDCGEGTLGQLIRHFGVDRYKDEIRKIKAIFISHFHGDHHLGLMGILNERKELKMDEEPLYLCLSENLLIWVNPLFQLFKEKNIHRNIRMLYNQFLDPFHMEDINVFLKNNTASDNTDASKRQKVSKILNIKKRIEEMHKALRVEKFITVPVTHSSFSYGCKITTTDGFRLVYSGDCRPSKTLIEAGKDCDLLIHEATDNDEGLFNAKANAHSTISEAIDVANNMNAQNLIITHFGRRLTDTSLICDDIVACKTGSIAFDHMVVNRANLHKAPLYNKLIKHVFDYNRSVLLRELSKYRN